MSQPGTNKLNYITQQNDFIKSIGKEKIMINKEAYLTDNTFLSTERTIMISGRWQRHLRLFSLFDVYVPPDRRGRNDYRKKRQKR